MDLQTSLRTHTAFIDEAGRQCIRVPLANCDRSAVLYADCYERLMGAGISGNWSFNYAGTDRPAYVRVKIPGANTNVVARLVAGARFQERVRYRNGDHLDLRLDNLLVTKGGRAHKDCLAILAVEVADQEAD